MNDNKIQSRINELVKQRDDITATMTSMQEQFEQLRTQLIATNGAIQVLSDMFSEGDKGDTEDKTETGSNINKG